jgi:hypothetical protein
MSAMRCVKGVIASYLEFAIERERVWRGYRFENGKLRLTKSSSFSKVYPVVDRIEAVKKNPGFQMGLL